MNWWSAKLVVFSIDVEFLLIVDIDIDIDIDIFICISIDVFICENAGKKLNVNNFQQK